MPIFYQHDINLDTKLGVWRIEEDESFFLREVLLRKEVNHPHKRLQHLAGRFLLKMLFGDFPVDQIVIAESNRPFLKDEKYHFSISHCANFAAAIVSRRNQVGIDVEVVHPRIEKIRSRFLAAEEFGLALSSWPGDLLRPMATEAFSEYIILTALWSAKEAIFKWYGKGQVDFKRDIRLCGRAEVQSSGRVQLPFRLSKSGASTSLCVEVEHFGPQVVAWTIG